MFEFVESPFRITEGCGLLCIGCGLVLNIEIPADTEEHRNQRLAAAKEFERAHAACYEDHKKSVTEAWNKLVRPGAMERGKESCGKL